MRSIARRDLAAHAGTELAFWYVHKPAADAGTFAGRQRRSLAPGGLADAYGRASLYRVGLVVLAGRALPARLRPAPLESFAQAVQVPGPYMYKPPLTG